MTIGDVLAVVFGVIGICGSVWSMLVGTALVFRAQSEKARTIWVERPWPAIGTGVVCAATIGFIAIALLNQNNGLLKLIGWGGLLALLSISTLGASGLSRLVGSQVTSDEPQVSPFGALTRGTGLLVVAGIVPFLGWFFIGPFVIISSLGVGILTLRRRSVTETTSQPLRENTPLASNVPVTLTPSSEVPAAIAPVFPAEQPSALTPPIIQEWSPVPVTTLNSHTLNPNGSSVEATR